MMMTTRRNFMLGMTAVAGLPLWAKGGEPPAESGRAHDYRVLALADGKSVLERRVFAPHYYRAPSVSRGMCKCVFPLDELPSGNFTFEVRPVAENGREGRPVLVKFAGA